MTTELEHNQTKEIGVLSDKSIICVKREFTQSEGEYSIIRKMKGGLDINDMILEDGFLNISAAVERAWFFFNSLNK